MENIYRFVKEVKKMLPVVEIQNVIAFLKDRTSVPLPVFVKSLGTILIFLSDFLNFQRYADGPVVEDVDVVEKLEELLQLHENKKVQGVPVWLKPLALKLLELAIVYLKNNG